MTKNINGSYAEEWVTAEDTLVLTVDVKDSVPPYNQSKLNHVKHRYPSKPENLIFDRLLISNPESKRTRDQHHSLLEVTYDEVRIARGQPLFSL